MQTIHRADLLKVLVQNTPSNYNTHFSKRLMSYVDKAPGPIILKFSDGTTATCDILVGADGINSSVRENMYNSLATSAESRGSSKAKADQFRRHASARWSGQTIYRSIIPKEALTSFQHDHPSLSMPVEVRFIRFSRPRSYANPYIIVHGKGQSKWAAYYDSPVLTSLKIDDPNISHLPRERGQCRCYSFQASSCRRIT